jgi:hypothetical protein
MTFLLHMRKNFTNLLRFIMQIVLKDESDIDPNDQNSILEHLDTVVSPVSYNWQGQFWIF